MTSEEVIKYYGKRYSNYRPWAPDDYYNLIIKIIKEVTGDISDKVILDVGCGYGDMLFRIVKYGGRAYGIDISGKGMEYARKIAPRAVVKLAACENIPFKDNLFDIVFCSGVIEHFNDIDGGLKEIRRVLKPSGYLVTVVPNKKWVGKLYEWLGLNLIYRMLHKLQSNQPIERELTLKNWCTRLISAGFSVAYLGRYNLDIEIPIVRKPLIRSEHIPLPLSYHFVIICNPEKTSKCLS